MTATIAEERSRSRTADRPREMPVLFHLLDVGRPSGAKPPAQPAVKEAAVAGPAETKADAKPEAKAEHPAAQCASDAPPAAETETIAKTAVAPTNPPVVAASEPATQKPADVGEHIALVDDATDPIAAAADAVLAETVGAAAAALPAEGAPIDRSLAMRATMEPAPRSRFDRRRQLASLAKDEWLNSHAKYIAIGFVLALIGTIYLARVTRTTTPVAKQEVQQDPPSITELAAAVEAKPALLDQARPATGSTGGNSTAVSPAKLAEAPPARSQASLHPPTVPQLPVQASATTSETADERLFPWANGEPRLASRPSEPASVDNPTLQGSAPAGSWQNTQQAVTSPPAAGQQNQAHQPQSRPAYPNTGYPAELPPPGAPAYGAPAYGAPAYGAPAYGAPAYGAPGNAGPGYGATSPQPQYPTTHAASQQQHSAPQAAAPPATAPGSAFGPGSAYGPGPAYGPGSAYAPGGAYAPPAQPWNTQPQTQPHPNLPPDNSVRGSRYERTGSGLY